MRMTRCSATRGSAPSARTWTLSLPHLMLPESIRVGFTDKLSRSAKTARPGLVALLDHARPGDTVVVAAIDRLGRSVAEVTRTIADLGERRITLHVLREGVDTATPTGRAIAAIMASLAELELELGASAAPHPENPVAPGICRPPNPRSSAQNGKNSCAGLP